MSTSPEVQAARKKMQKLRLEAKKLNKGKDYPAYYAAQPFQVERARMNKEYHAAQQKLKDANNALEVAEITGESLEEAKKAQAIAAIVEQRSKPARRGESASAGLTGV